MGFSRAIASIFIAIIATGVYLGGCGDKGVNPRPGLAKDYRVYFADVEQLYKYYAFHTTTGVVDSFTLPYESWPSGFGISPDGKTMYLNPPGRIAEVSLDSYCVIAEHPTEAAGREVIASPDARHLAVIGSGLFILDITDFSIVYHNTNDVFNGRFSPDGSKLLCAGQDSSGVYALEVDIAGGFRERKVRFYNGAVWPWLMVPDRTGKKWFVFLWIYNDLFQFEVYDVLGDSATFEYVFAPGHGDMVLTPDGRYLAFSQPGRLNSDVPPPCYFTLFDVKAGEIYRQVSTCGFVNDSVPVLAAGDLAITPDGRWLIGTAALGGGEIFSFNLETMQMDKYVFLGYNKMLFYLTCQSQP